MSASKKPRSGKDVGSSQTNAPRYWNLRQALWWILKADWEAASRIPRSGTLADLERVYCAELIAGPKAAIPVERASSFKTLSIDQQEQIDQAESALRPLYSDLVMGGGKTLVDDYKKVQEHLPTDASWALPWAEARLQWENEAY